MSPKKEAFAAMAKTIIENLQKRNMEGYFFESSADCVKRQSLILSRRAASSVGAAAKRLKKPD